MGFKKTSEGRVFFKSANNDDLPDTPINIPSDSQISKDSTQVQILLLLKTLNEKLQESREDNTVMKKTLETYKAKITSLEDHTLKQQNNYIDLEQKVAEKQNESSKKTTRVENSVKTTLKQLEEAHNLVKALEGKYGKQEISLKEIKDDINGKTEENTKEAQKIAQLQKDLDKKHKELEEKQQDQSEKMVSNVAAYVALTKRVSETETRQDALDNKIEDSTTQYLKLDRKIDKVIEDRGRLLRKIDRIENAVIETRDALNAKAMVLLTD
ncbi:MAG: hypothetical protein KAJ40_04545, partial [Alphaproteobacteria bacterium]|nr:hypothetical protein [Alphaproteobacteria bacterium]